MLIRPADMVRTKAPEADLRRQYAKTFWSCFGISALLLWWGVIAREERYLERKFGAQYLTYKARVRRWL